MIRNIAVKSVRKAKSSELLKRAQSSTSLSARKAQSKELASSFSQVVKRKLGRNWFLKSLLYVPVYVYNIYKNIILMTGMIY